MFLINGQYPGEQLDLEEGDDVEIVMKNSASQGLSLHFHGIEQKDTVYSDGVAGVTQRTTQPGESFTYRWKATERGFYHAHAHRSKSFFWPTLSSMVLISLACRATPG
jgi:FtsP/CotA-like multicopper oxidase with cupredoxin domain